MQRITRQTIEDGLQIVKNGAGVISRYAAIVWEDPQTRARVIDLVAATAFSVRNAAETTGDIYRHYFDGAELRGNEVELLEDAARNIEKNKQTLKEIDEGTPETVEVAEVLDFTTGGKNNGRY